MPKHSVEDLKNQVLGFSRDRLDELAKSLRDEIKTEADVKEAELLTRMCHIVLSERSRRDAEWMRNSG